MSKRLALNSEGDITYCSANPGEEGKGRCNHIFHARENESAPAFLERVYKEKDYNKNIEKAKEIISKEKSENKDLKIVYIDENGYSQIFGEESKGPISSARSIESNVKYIGSISQYPRKLELIKQLKEDFNIDINQRLGLVNLEISSGDLEGNFYGRGSDKSERERLENFILENKDLSLHLSRGDSYKEISSNKNKINYNSLSGTYKGQEIIDALKDGKKSYEGERISKKFIDFYEKHKDDLNHKTLNQICEENKIIIISYTHYT